MGGGTINIKGRTFKPGEEVEMYAFFVDDMVLIRKRLDPVKNYSSHEKWVEVEGGKIYWRDGSWWVQQRWTGQERDYNHVNDAIDAMKRIAHQVEIRLIGPGVKILYRDRICVTTKTYDPKSVIVITEDKPVESYIIEIHSFVWLVL